MLIAVASGKGGTGKTTISLNMAVAADEKVVLADSDVEEPNVHLFVKPEIEKTLPATVKEPVVDFDLCTSCGACREACRFNAIVLIKGRPIVMHELCHSCGACVNACLEGAISEEDREIGIIEEGTWKNGEFYHGILKVGEARSEPLIGEIRERLSKYTDCLVILDAPPGTSCPVMAAIKGVDFLLLVTEPTPFGLHDLKLAVKLARVYSIPTAVVLNRSDIGDSSVRDYCESEGVPVIAEFPFSKEVAEAYSRGQIGSEVIDGLREKYKSLLDTIKGLAEAGRYDG